MVTIKEIARMAGVSTTTVSNVLHKKNARVSEQMIEKVEKLLAENNYIPRLGLNALTNRSSRIICILITTPEFARGSAYETPFYGNMLGNLERLLRENGYYIMIFSDKNVEEIEKMTVGWNVDGIITISMPYRHLKKIAGLSDIPIVSIDMDEMPEGDEVYYQITSEDKNGGKEMGRYLIGQGVKRIVYLANVNHGADHLRFVGVREAVREADYKVLLEEKRLPKDYTQREKCYEDFLKYVGTDTALFFSTDVNAAEMISFLHRNHVKIPEEISVAGMDDDIFASIVYPRLTTIRVNVEEKAQTAVDILLKLIRGEKCEKNVYKTSVKLIERESVKIKNLNA